MSDAPPAFDPPVDVLWTGGWDSTFRVLSLLSEGRTVRPHYLEYPGRDSVPEERAAIAEIRAGAAARGWGDRLLPLIAVSTEDLDPDPEVESRLETLQTRAYCGKQYAYLSRYALQRLGGRPLDLSVHLDDRAEFFVRPHAVPDVDGDGYALGPSADDATRLFAPFRFPLLDLTKEEMRETSEERGFADLMKKTWFCHNPVRRSRGLAVPCGVCLPCRYSHEEGMGHRIGFTGHARRIAVDNFGPTVKGLSDLRVRLGVGTRLRALVGR
ncbi:MAG: hypothetical protein AAF845_18175 [Bacteroidota bacterium]